MPERQRAAIPAQIASFTLIRTVVNTSLRMIYPFLPAMARGLGISFQQMALAVTARSSVGLIGPLLGTVGDRRGRKAAMLLSLGLFSAGLLIVVLWPTYPALIAALMISMAGKISFDAVTQAYLGDNVPYERRGRAIAITEIGWSTAILLGVPAAGWLIARQGWSAPFPWLAGLGVVAAIWLWVLIPKDPTNDAPPSHPLASLRQIVSHRPAMAGLAVSLLISLSNEIVNIVYGAWLEDSFGLQITALGLASMVIGLSELGGEGLVATISDRLGKRRAVIYGSVAIVAACVALPLLGRTIAGALVGLFCFYISFEFAFVSLLSLMTELTPGARATLMAGNIAAVDLGRMIGTVIGPALFGYGLLANGIASAVVAVGALAVTVVYVQAD